MLLKVNMSDKIVDQKDLLSFFYERRWYNEIETIDNQKCEFTMSKLK